MAKINKYPQAVTINNNDLFVIDQESGGDHATKSASVSQIADKVTDGLTANDIPLTSSDPTPTATAIGDLSTLTTSDKSSLVGAVNDVNGKTKPTTVTPTFNSSQSNYSIPFNNTKVYKIGNIVYFTSTIQSDTPYGSSPGQNVYSGLPKPYSNDNIYMGFCAWNITSNNMRVIVTSDGKLQCRGGNTGTAYDVSFSYVCQ